MLQKSLNLFIFLSLIFFLILLTPFLISKSESHTRRSIVTLEKYILITDYLKILKDSSLIFNETNLYILSNKKKIKMIFSSEDYKFNFSEINLDKILNNKNKFNLFSIENCMLYFSDDKEKIIQCYLEEINSNHCILELKINNEFENIVDVDNINIEETILRIKEIIKSTLN